jgi:hypothetical protein
MRLSARNLAMKPTALIALALLALSGTAPAALAQETTAAAPAGRWAGLPVTEITGRLTAAGLTVSEPQVAGDRVYLRVDDGPLRWVLTLFSCTNGACPDVQFTAAFTGPQANEAVIGRWNGERRFVKAFYAAPEEGSNAPGQAVAQYDVLLNAGGGAAQLDDPIQVWRSLAIDLGRTVSPRAD